jgi:hypothetical protein
MTENQKDQNPSDFDRAKDDVKGAVDDAKKQAGRLADKLKDEETRKKVGDFAGKLKGLRRRV